MSFKSVPTIMMMAGLLGGGVAPHLTTSKAAASCWESNWCSPGGGCTAVRCGASGPSFAYNCNACVVSGTPASGDWNCQVSPGPCLS